MRDENALSGAVQLIVAQQAELVERAGDGAASAVQDVRVDLRGLDAAVAELLLDRPDIGAAFEKVRGEGVPEGVAGHVPVDTGPPGGLLDRSRHDGLVEVVPASDAGSRVNARPGSRENVLPGQFGGGVRVLPAQSIRHLDTPESLPHRPLFDINICGCHHASMTHRLPRSAIRYRGQGFRGGALAGQASSSARLA